MADQSIPDEVLDALEDVRDGGDTNMMDRRMVMSLVQDEDAERWLRANESRYMTALRAMGDRRAARALDAGA